MPPRPGAAQPVRPSAPDNPFAPSRNAPVPPRPAQARPVPPLPGAVAPIQPPEPSESHTKPAEPDLEAMMAAELSRGGERPAPQPAPVVTDPEPSSPTSETVETGEVEETSDDRSEDATAKAGEKADGPLPDSAEEQKKSEDSSDETDGNDVNIYEQILKRD